MKATGIVRRVDDLGRIVIPKEIRRTLRICDEPYGVYKISNIDGIAGYVVCESSDIGCEMEMIARYLDAVIAN